MIPIVLDPVLVDPEFGTGAVKITPAHDVNDHAAGMRHGLPETVIIGTRGEMLPTAGDYAGLSRFEARAKIIDVLSESGRLLSADAHPMALPMCSRSGDIIEPMLSEQWYVDCTKMAARAQGVVETGDLEILPTHFVATWNRWLGQIQDWCVSRQLWWGHQIPAYCASANGKKEWVAARNIDEARAKAAVRLGVRQDQVHLEQDQDVLDTWFSSALFPFASLGWPDKVPEDRFPGSLLETGHDILFFWVSRMVMLSLELTDRLPFKQVYLHAMVRDAQGKKMSKSLGNVIEPGDVIRGASQEALLDRISASNLSTSEKKRTISLQRKQFPKGIPECGADALRFALVSYTANARDIKFDVDRVLGHRRFLNKVWNATRFLLGMCGADDTKPIISEKPAPENLSLVYSAWILSRLAATIYSANTALQEYNFAGYTSALIEFWVGDLCDVYIELAKHDLQNDQDLSTGEEVRKVLATCIDNGIRLLAPATPFLADTIFKTLRPTCADPQPDVASASFPDTDAWTHLVDAELENDMAAGLAIARAIRAVPIQNIDPKATLDVWILAESTEAADTLARVEPVVRALCRASTLRVLGPNDDPVSFSGACTVPTHASCKCTVYAASTVPLNPEVIQLELARLSKSHDNLEKSRLKVEQRRSGLGYMRVPDAVKEKDALTLEQLERQINENEALKHAYAEWLITAKKQ